MCVSQKFTRHTLLIAHGRHSFFVCQTCILILHQVSIQEGDESESFSAELNCDKSGFVLVRPILSNISIKLMSEYVVALGHYTIPFEIK